MKKRILASLMAVCLIAGLLPTAALAAEPGTEQTALVAPGPEQESTGDPAGPRQEPIHPVPEDAVTQPEEEGDTKGTEANPYSLEEFSEEEGDTKGTKEDPYSRKEFSQMTRAEYIDAQKRLGGTMYVDIDDYDYETDGVLGNGTADNSVEDKTKLNYYGAPGAMSGKYSDEAVGKSVVFVGGTITSEVTGYTNIDQIGTSLLLAVPAYTNVTFRETTFNNVMRFNYQLYTSPWSQLGELKFEECTFNGIIVGATAAQTLTFDGCEFKDFTNTTDPNNSNPTWIRPAYGNWSEGDNEGQGDDFRSLTKINFINNTVTSTRPVKFEFISQWDITSTVTATDNYFDISAQAEDKETKNVGLYLGAHTDNNEFNLIVENNSKSDATAALYTIPAGKKSLPAGSTVKDSRGNEITIADALEWKTDNKVELKTEYEASAVAGINGVSYDTLDGAINAAKNGDTITILQEGSYAGTLLDGLSNKKATIKAADKVNVKFDMPKTDYQVVTLSDAEVTFEGIEFNYGTANYVGLAHTDRVVYNNCTINGQVFLYGASETFNDCTFNQNSADAYNVWTYGAKEVKFNDCTFNCAGKSVLVYNEGSNSGTDLTVTDTTFHASQLVEGKAAIEIDTSLMKGQTKISVDQATADKIDGFGVGSNSGSSLWNDKRQTVETNKNTTVVVAGKTVFEPTCVDLDTFIKMVENSNYNFDGTRGNGSKLTVKWSPVSGCFDTRSGHTCKVKNADATGNTPNRVNSDLAQYQLFKAATDVTIKNVNFEYIPADFTICANSDWAGSWTGDVVKSAQLQLETKAAGDIVIDGCSFDQVVFTSFNNNDGSTTIKNSEFKNIYNSYAIKDIRGTKVSVTDTTITNCGGGIMVSSTKSVDEVTISDNIFTNVDVTGTAPEDKVGTRGLIQIASSGDYTEADITLDGNTATNCGLILRQLNQGIADNDVLKNNLKGDLTGLGGKLTYTSDSVKKTDGNEPVQPTVYTVKFENADVAEMKVIQGTEITLPAPSHRPNYTFEGWYVGNNKVNSPYTVSGDVTLVAQWRYIDQGGGSSSGSGSSSGDYTVSVDADKHGTVTVSPKRADKGDTVTITVKPNKGYELDELTVTDANGNEISVRSRGNNQYTFTMPRSRVTIEATFAEIEEEPDLFFVDVPTSAYYYDAVYWAAENGVTYGTSATTFSPDVIVSRAQMVTFLWRAHGSPEPRSSVNPFTDITSDMYYYDAVLWAVENGVTNGTSATTFSPDATVTRAQAVTFQWRAAGSPAVSGGSFADVADSAYYAGAVSWAVANGVTNGTGGSNFSPDVGVSRAQAVTFLWRQLA